MRIVSLAVAAIFALGSMLFALVLCCGIMAGSSMPRQAPQAVGTVANETASTPPADLEQNASNEKPTGMVTAEPVEEPRDDPSEVEAFSIAQDVVRLHLKYPDDAEFHSFAFGDTSVGETADGLIIVRSKVKAANGFGAKLTHSWYAEVEYLGNDKYDVIRVALDDKLLYQKPGHEPPPEPTKEDIERVEREEKAAALRKMKAEQKEADRENQFRTWESANGQFSIEARMDRYANGTAVLEKRNGETVDVEESQLSEKDQLYIKDEIKRRANAR